MKKILILLLILATCLATMAQKKTPVINHIAVYVVNLQKSTAFYKDVVGLDTIPEPFHDGKHTWFSIGANAHLHIISGAASTTFHDKNNHLCFSVPSIEDFVSRLNQAGIIFENWAGEKKALTLRVDGIKQLWFQDPDGYWIEINNDYH